MKGAGQWLLAAALALVCAWAQWAVRQPAMVHQLAMLLPLC